VPRAALVLLGSDVLARFADQALVSVGNFAISVILARMLGPPQFGVFAVLWTVVLFALMAQWALITAPMQSSLAQSDPAGHTALFPALCSHSFVVALVGAGGAILVVLWAGGRHQTPVALTGIGAAVVAIVAQDFARRWLLATERPGWALVSDGVRQGGVLSVLFWMTGSGPVALATCVLVIGIGAAIGCLPLLRDLRRAPLRISTSVSWALRHSEFGRWLMPSVILQSVNASTPLYALGLSQGMAAVGGYRAGVALASPVIILTEALETFLPLRTRKAMLSGGPERLWRVLRGCFLLSFPVCVLYVAATYAFGSIIIVKTFGVSYANYVSVVLVLGIANLLQVLVYVFNVALRAMERSNAIVTGDIIATIVLGVLLLGTVSVATPLTVGLCVVVHQAVKLIVLATSARRLQAPFPRGL
jgi:O-antigen/teichoic acid export membrane protein